MLTYADPPQPTHRCFAFYCHAMDTLDAAGVPFLVGGAFALQRYTGIGRDTKDFDIFVRPADAQAALDALSAAGYATELTYPHWLGKAWNDDDFVDIIFSSGNGVATVDDEWFAHAVEGRVFDRAVKLCPIEEIIWSKSFVMERERYDGADINHLVHASASDIDWRRLLERFAGRWRVLFSHLMLFTYVYPGERAKVPAWVIEELARRMVVNHVDDPRYAGVCQGPFISRAQYLIDIEEWGYQDARTLQGTMREEEITAWTAAARDPNAP